MVCSRWIFAPIVVNSITGALSFYLYFVIFVVFYIVAAFFVRRSLNELAARSGVSLFATAGLLLFIGAILTLIVIGALIMWVSFVVLAIAFFKLKEPQPSLLHTEISTSPTSSYQMISEVNVKADFCSNCGTPTTPQAVFCAHCGKQTAQ